MPEENSHSLYPLPIACVIMAAGVSRRFQKAEDPSGGKVSPNEKASPKNKLLVDFLGKPLIQWTLDCFSQVHCLSRLLIARDHELLKTIYASDFHVLWNNDDNLDPSVTIKMAMAAIPTDAIGCLFAVGDQPFLTFSSVNDLCQAFMKNPDKITALSWKAKRGNPIIFPRRFFPELSTLENGSTGRSILEKYPDMLQLVDAGSPYELMDIDTQLEYIKAHTEGFSSAE